MLLAALVAVVLSVVLHVRYGGGTVGRIATESMDVHSDFDTFWQSARAASFGQDIYSTDARLVNLNPPFWTLVVLPFGALPSIYAYRLFILLSVFMILGSTAWMAGELRLRAGWAVLAAGMILVSSPMLATLALGQMYPFLVLGLVAAWVADRRGLDVPSGAALGLVMALKPSLAPLILWPALRKKWESVVAVIVSGVTTTVAAALAFGPDQTLRYLEVLLDEKVDGFWDNASLAGFATRTFTDTRYAEPLAMLPSAIPMAYALGIVAIILTAIRFRDGSEVGLWALTAATLLASPIAWNNYLLLLAPGVLLLLARGRIALAILLFSLQFIPPQWPFLWQDTKNLVATAAVSLYAYVLITHWVSFLAAGQGDKRAPRVTVKESPAAPD
ncbi:hypothetical protein BH23ACT11_BH23ACT11_24190 [soil metagenome]